MSPRPFLLIVFASWVASLGVVPALAPRSADVATVQAGSAAGQEPQAPDDNPNDACLTCHGEADAKAEDGRSVAVNASRFAESVHGALGLTCTTCHADLDGKELPHESSLARVDCAMCHEDQVKEYDTSIHAAVRREQPGRVAATCVNCHTAHETQSTKTGEWRMNLVGECGTCHADRIKTYRDTFHGQVTSLGFARVAKCSDCHGAHAIHSQTDARSMVSDARRLETCQKCHTNATAGFARYDPHADKDNVERNPELYYAARFMHWLLIGVFGFFGVHAMLWLPRSARERRRHAEARRNGDES